ncbi:hypothetical protein GQ44DRAFT_726751 [Phaeosphaeriaceae sp. PMI808]|nr:hypothetical protein GQ44DRAFT_726751 [Phaeosphaeriaceae sp. PMI808]
MSNVNNMAENEPTDFKWPPRVPAAQHAQQVNTLPGATSSTVLLTRTSSTYTLTSSIQGTSQIKPTQRFANTLSPDATGVAFQMYTPPIDPPPVNKRSKETGGSNQEAIIFAVAGTICVIVFILLFAAVRSRKRCRAGKRSKAEHGLPHNKDHQRRQKRNHNRRERNDQPHGLTQTQIAETFHLGHVMAAEEHAHKNLISPKSPGSVTTVYNTDSSRPFQTYPLNAQSRIRADQPQLPQPTQNMPHGRKFRYAPSVAIPTSQRRHNCHLSISPLSNSFGFIGSSRDHGYEDVSPETSPTQTGWPR